jgi:cell division transport system ATP-binding protein
VEILIKVKKLKKAFKGNQVIRGIDLHLEMGEYVFLKGESGSGKSTLLKILYRDIEEFEGEIWIDSQSIKQIPRYQARRVVGTIFQSFELLERKTALENVALAGEVLGRNENEIKKEAVDLLEKVGLKGKENSFPQQLSGGEQQRVAIARALLNRPKVLLADEPTGNLDPTNALKIMELLKEINEKEGITMLIVTHSQEIVRAIKARTMMIVDGMVNECD